MSAKHGINNQGFGLVESIITVALFATVLSMGLFFKLQQNRNYNAQNLAGQTNKYIDLFGGFTNDPSIYSDVMHAEQNKCPFSLVSGSYKYYGFNDVKLALQNNMASCIDSGKVVAFSIPNNMLGTNLYGESACFAVYRNPQGDSLEGYLYYVGTPTTREDTRVVQKAVEILGGQAAMYDATKSIINSSGGWSLPINSPILAGCNGKTISPHSIIVNLSANRTFNQYYNDSAIHKDENGDDNKIGNIGSFKTMGSDVIFGLKQNNSQSQIFLSGINSNYQLGIVANNYISDSSNGNKTISITQNNAPVSNTLIQTDSIQPTERVTPGAICQKSEVGKMKLSNNERYGISVCRADKYYCGFKNGVSTNYCHEPELENCKTNVTVNGASISLTYQCS